MASNSDIVSMMKFMLNMLNDMRKDSTATNEEQVAMETTSSDKKSLEQGERLSPSTLEVAFLGLSSAVKENMKDLNDILSNKISQLEERIITLEDVKGRRHAAIESECFTSEEIKVVPDRISSLEEKICTLEEKKAIPVSQSSLEDKMGKLGKTREIAVRQPSLEDNMNTLEVIKAIAISQSSPEDKMGKLKETREITVTQPSLEGNMSTSEEIKAIAVRQSSLEDKMSKLEEKIEIVVREPSPEDNMSTSDETKAIVDRLSSLESMVEKYEQKFTSLFETKGIERNSTGTEEGITSKEPTLPQQFDSLCKGRKVVLTNNYLTAERIDRPNVCGEFGGVISKFPLKEEEVFNIIIEETNGKYREFGIAFGVISDKKAEVEGVWSIIDGIKGTWAIKSWYDSPKGKSHVYKDNDIINEDAYPLDTRNLPVGTVLGVKLCRNGDVHLFLNGLDKGVAFQNVPNNVFPFIDIINYVTKIRIV